MMNYQMPNWNFHDMRRPDLRRSEERPLHRSDNSNLSSAASTRSMKKKSTEEICTPTCKMVLSVFLILLCLAVVIVPIVAVVARPTTTTTMSTTTTTTTQTTTSTSTTSSVSTATTSTTTSTTTTMACAATCVNTSISAASLIAFYSFDSVTTDATGTYPLSWLVSPTYVSGWIGSAITFNAANSERLSTSNLPINGRSFSIDFWFYALNVSSGWDIPFMGQYTAQAQRQCLFLSIYFSTLYIGFFGDDTPGNTSLSPNTWYHAAFTFDGSTLQRSIYLNGVLDGQGSTTGTLQSSSQGFTIGGARVGGRVPTLDSYYTGYIDHVTVSTRVKSACEIYLAANLACYFTFNTASPPLDSGASGLTAVNTGASSVIGVISQALQFSSVMTYITVTGISALKSASNSPFSISMWVRPTTISGGGTLIHASTLSNGQATCLTMWGLTLTGRVSVNIFDASSAVVSATAVSALQVNVWTHIAQTFSSSNGMRLYINGRVVATTSAPTGRSVGPVTIIGTALAGTSSCPAGFIAPGQFYGAVDDYRVFRVELTSTDICRLSNPL